MTKYFLLVLLLSACTSGTGPTPTSSPTSAIFSTATPTSSVPSIRLVGEPEAVYRWESDRCADDMLPDLPTRAIRGANGGVQLTISSSTNYRLIGADFDSLEPDCSPVMLSDKDRNPEHYNHSEWLGAVYTEDGRTIHAIVHNEYHGDQAGSLWQADLDFGPEQKMNDWAYQSWDGSSYSEMVFDESRNEWTGIRPLCLISPQAMHPDSGCEPSRTWTSPITGLVTLSGNVRDLDSNGGDGVVATIFKGNQELWSATIDNGDEEMYPFELEVEVLAGDQIHFGVDSRGDAGWDTTLFNPGINFGPAPCPSNRHDMCTLISLTSAVSTDGGRTYTQASPPGHMLANFPAPYDPGWMRAIWQPSNIVRHPTDGYYYVLIQYDEHSADYTTNAQGMCLIRTQALADPDSWRAWDGTGFDRRFTNPYVETDTDPEEQSCELVTPEIGALTYGLSYNTYLDKFIAVGVSGGAKPGFYYALSGDLVQWSSKELIMEAEMGFLNGNTPPFSAYPTLIDHDSPSMSFDLTGQNAHLYYTEVTNNNPWSMDLLRIQIEFNR